MRGEVGKKTPKKRWIIFHFYDVTWLIFETPCKVTIPNSNLHYSSIRHSCYFQCKLTRTDTTSSGVAREILQPMSHHSFTLLRIFLNFIGEVFLVFKSKKVCSSYNNFYFSLLMEIIFK